MSNQRNETHICMEQLGTGCRCTVCGKICHDYRTNNDGTFAASGKVVTARCVRCGDQVHYDADSGVEIEDYRFFKPEPDPVHPSRQAPQSELLYMVIKMDEKYIISGITERSVAEKLGLRHLTVIVVPFVMDGTDKGFWIIHNRHDKQIAKGKTSAPLSLNLFGGHCGPSDDDITGRIGQMVENELLCENALRELSEEFLCKKGMEKRLELWSEGLFAGEYLYASPYEVCYENLIPIGFTGYTAKDNVEYSYIFALPVPGSQVDQIIAADNYHKYSQTDGKAYEIDIALPVVSMAESELKRLWESRNPQIEVCDAITRLWEEQNHATYQRLLECIRNHGVI